jgi:uncharacterized membrane protein YukC
MKIIGIALIIIFVLFIILFAYALCKVASDTENSIDHAFDNDDNNDMNF